MDDDPPTRDLVVEILRAEGFACRTASNGEEALQACAAASPDLIIMDITMPVMDGLETCRRLKATPAWASIPVIVLTGADKAAPVIRMLDAGSLLSLNKPFTAARLVAAVHLALMGSRPEGTP